jgi:hypothetical protein
MSTSSQILDRIASFPTPKALLLIPELYDLILAEKHAWSAYSDNLLLTSYTHTIRAYTTHAIDGAALRGQTLYHLMRTLPARLAMLSVKGTHHPESDNGNGKREQVARMLRSLQAMREILQAGYPILFQMVDLIMAHENAYTVLEVEHADAVESVRVAMMMDFAEGRIRGTEDVVVFAERMVAIGICLEGLFDGGGEVGVKEVAGELGGVGILPWW